MWNGANPEGTRDPFFFRDVNRGAAYDFDRAQTMIFNALTADARWEGLVNPAVPDLSIDEFDGVVPGEEASVSLFTTVSGTPDDHATVLCRIRTLDSPTTLLSGEAVLVEPGE